MTVVLVVCAHTLDKSIPSPNDEYIYIYMYQSFFGLFGVLARVQLSWGWSLVVLHDYPPID